MSTYMLTGMSTQEFGEYASDHKHFLEQTLNFPGTEPRHNEHSFQLLSIFDIKKSIIRQ